MWQRARMWWMNYTGEADTPLDGDTPGWLVSLVLHVILLVAVGAVGLDTLPERPAVIVVTTLPKEPEVDLEAIVELADIGERPTEVTQKPAPAHAVLPFEQVTNAPTVIELPPLDVTTFKPQPVSHQSPENVSPNELLAPLAVRSASVEASTTATGVLDRLTVEIIASLEQRSTVVCWVFDRSLSLAKQRQEIAARLDRVATEIEASPVARASELLNIVYGYGQQVTRVTSKPIREIDRVSAAIRQIPVDDSGVEMTFTAIDQAARDAVAIRNRRQPEKLNLMVVVFTDEAGDDQQDADRVATFCSRTANRVFVVGVPAPFGQAAVRFKFKEFDPQYADVEAWAEVNQGPESRYPEVVRILMGGPLDDPMDSGFGPFSLCKLCRISGGTYFAIHPDRNRRGQVSRIQSAAMAAHLRYFFDPEVMRAYRPTHNSDQAIQGELATNAAKAALIRAAEYTAGRPLAGLSGQVMRFLAVDQARLIKDLSQAQRDSAALEPKIDVVLQILEAGRAARNKIPASEKRWQAGYDLALGRTLALKARTLGYNMMLADAKSMKFSDSRNNTWILERGEPGGVKPIDSRLRKVIEEARVLLERVVSDHPGTPWALVASEELRTPLGYSWREAYTAPPPPPNPSPPPGPPPPTRPPKDDERRELPKPKPRRLPAKI